jgi:anti-repressor protein
MTELVSKSQKGNPVTTSLIVAEVFEKNHKDVLRAIKNTISSAQNCAQYFYSSTYKDSSGKRNEMFIMNRDGFSLLVMGFTGEKALKFKISFIEAFNAMEQKLRQSVEIPQSFAEALELAAHQAREIEAKDRLIAIQAPKAELADRLIDTETRVDIGQAAKLLKLPYGRNTFFKELRDRGIFFKNRNEPKQEYVERGYFQLFMVVIPTNTHGDLSKTKIVVPQKGLSWLAKTFGTELNDQLPNLNAI